MKQSYTFALHIDDISTATSKLCPGNFGKINFIQSNIDSLLCDNAELKSRVRSIKIKVAEFDAF